jgi:7-cyano-7-deazaguanine reductase
MKLYLNSFNQAAFPDAASVTAALEGDLSRASGAHASVALDLPREVRLQEGEGESIDGLDVELRVDAPDASHLRTGEGIVEETLQTNLLKTNCPLTGQPDWASLQVRYRGTRIVRESLLRYVVSFRLHRDFHEHCVERIFMDLVSRCRPESLSVEARYTRRGGIDINPFRTNRADAPSRLRTPRQ